MSGRAEEAPEPAIGYCAPPKHSRFKKGESGNPKGRRRQDEAHSIRGEIWRAVRARIVTIVQDGKTVRLPAVEAVALTLVNMALQKNLKAIEIILKLDELNDNIAFGGEGKLSPEEQAIIDRLVVRHQTRAG